MKRYLPALLLAILWFSGSAGRSIANPIDFQIDGLASSVSVSGFAIGSLTAKLDAHLDSQHFMLADGESQPFDFFTLTLIPSQWGIGLGAGSVEATLAFEKPAVAGGVSGSGDDWWFTILGQFSGGQLIWDDSMPRTITLANGDSFDVDFTDIFEFGWGNSATVQAVVTAHETTVPVPGTLLLLGSGLLGMVGVSRRMTGRPGI